MGKEIIEEEKTVDVPVTHEEVVIERRSLNNETTDSPISDTETICKIGCLIIIIVRVDSPI